MDNKKYSELFLNKNSKAKERVKLILYSGNTLEIERVINTRINILSLDNNFVSEDDGLFSLVFDHYTCQRIQEGKDDPGINIYLNKIIDYAYNNKQIYFVNSFLPFKLGLNEIKKYLDNNHLNKLQVIERQRTATENKYGNIVKIENNYVYFDNGEKVGENTFLKYLITNCPTRDSKILKLQDKYFTEKMKLILSNVRVENKLLVLSNGMEATLKNLNLSSLLIHFIAKYNFYDELSDNRYYDTGQDKSLIRDDVVFNFCSSFKSSNGYAFYSNQSLSGAFSLNNILSGGDILFFLLASRHEARHAVQFNSKNSQTLSVRNAHLDSIMHSLNPSDYSLNYHSQTIEHDANRKAIFSMQSLLNKIGRSDLHELVEKKRESKITALLLEIRTNQNGDKENIWDYEGKFIDKLTIKDLDDYPELGFLFKRNQTSIEHIKLIDLFKNTNLYLKGTRIFESSFISNYVRYRSLKSNELLEVVEYMLHNNVDVNSTLYNNAYGLLWNLDFESETLAKEAVGILKKWEINTSTKDNSNNNVKLINPFFARIETGLAIVNKMKVLAPKYPGIDKEINRILSNNYTLIKNVIEYYKKLKDLFEAGNLSYTEMIKNLYHLLLFANKIEDLSRKYYNSNISSEISIFKNNIVSYFSTVSSRIQNDSKISINEKNILLKRCLLSKDVTEIRDTEGFLSYLNSKAK